MSLAATAQPPTKTRCGFAEHATPDIIRKVQEGVQAVLRPNLPAFVESADGRFRVHYATSGPDAVPNVDADGNSLPDYIDACLNALGQTWRTEVDTLGYLPPPADGTEGGSASLDVYVRDLSKAGPSGSSYYGITTIEKLIGSVPVDRYTSWIEVDNDFSEDDRDVSGARAYSTFGVDALKVTCAHEFHHTIQNGSYGLANTQLMFYELTSTWMELRVWPDVQDWAVYANELFEDPERWPFSNVSPSTGYVWGWFGNVLAEIDPSTMRLTWEKIAQGSLPFKALVDACLQRGSTFTDIFCGQLPTIYRTGSRGATNTIIPNATELSEIRFYSNESAAPPSAISGGNIHPFETRAIRFLVPSISSSEPVSVDVILTWPNETAFINGNSTSLLPYTVTVTSSPLPTDAIIAGTSWGLRVSPAEICSYFSGAQTRKPVSPYPQPISLSKTRRLYVPITDNLPGDNVTLTLMNSMTIGITSVIATVELDGDLIVAPFDMPTDLSPGTYLVRVENKMSSSLLKIAVKR
ncbi:MAG: hypothetical protein H7X70_03520 [Candidatus Kapabacteria bacterium]|nr:hypothetical protein [Candidatus Kapabacteria bacterium]